MAVQAKSVKNLIATLQTTLHDSKSTTVRMNHLSRIAVHVLFRCALLLVVFLLFATHTRLVAAAPVETAEETLLVHFAEGSTLETREALADELGGELVNWIPQIDVAEIRLPVNEHVTTASYSALLMTNHSVIHAERNMLVSAAYEPGDPDFSDKTMCYGFEQIEVLQAWDIVTGSQEIVIALIDSGINSEHPEFAGRLVAGYDFIDNDEIAEDRSGHGTHVAGIIAAALDNNEGVAGVCPNCSLMPVKVLNENNLGSWAQLAQGIIFAVDNGARILNLSLGASIPSETLASAID